MPDGKSAADTIVIGTDSSSASKKAVAYAGRLARIERRKLKIVFVRSFFPTETSEAGDVDDQQLMRGMLNDAAQSGIDLKRVDCIVVSGRPDHEILRIATESHAAYIVIGTHCKRGFDRLVLGSVAESVLHRANLPVIIVGPKAEENGQTSVPWKRVLLAVDLTADISEAMRLVGELKDAQLTILNIQPDGIYQLPEHQFNALESIMTREAWMRLMPKCIVRGGDLATQVAHIVKDSHADLLVINSRADDQRLVHLRPSKIARVLCAAPCPVMILRQKDSLVSRGSALLSAEMA